MRRENVRVEHRGEGKEEGLLMIGRLGAAVLNQATRRLHCNGVFRGC